MQIPQVEDPTLHLPRILCLHGGGTNARIFRMQCRVFQRVLHSTFRLVYAQAPFPSQPGPDVTSVYRECGPFRAWLRWKPDDPEHDGRDTADQINTALTTAIRADDLQGATGEWIALLGFSQGAKIATSILYSQQWSGRNAVDGPAFRFAVLLAGRGPLVWLRTDMSMPPGLVDAACPSTSTYEPVLDGNSDQHILHIPTIHVHGLKDPGLELHRRLLERYCDPDSVTVLEWDGEHRVPIKSKDVNVIVEQIYYMARKTGVVGFRS